MTDELLRKGLKSADKMHIKQKYAEFRCSVSTYDKKRALEFTKILTTYTRLINSICQDCDQYGELESINRWDVRLCSEHYSQQMNLEYNENVSTKPIITEDQYRFAAESKFNRINDHYALIKISLLKHNLEQKNIDASIIREVLFASLDLPCRFELDENYYSVITSFENDDGDKVNLKENFYSNQDYLWETINNICT